MAAKFPAEVQSAPERRSPLPSSPAAMPPSPRGRLNPLSHGLRRASSPERGSFLFLYARCIKPRPLGEVDATSGSRRRGRAPTFPQRCAFAESGAANAIFLYDPSRENSVWSAPQSATNAKFKIFFPLIMRKANAARIPNRLFAARNVQPFPLFHPQKLKIQLKNAPDGSKNNLDVLY